jgi:serine/threonine protein kinase
MNLQGLSVLTKRTQKLQGKIQLVRKRHNSAYSELSTLTDPSETDTVEAVEPINEDE